MFTNKPYIEIKPDFNSRRQKGVNLAVNLSWLGTQVGRSFSWMPRTRQSYLSTHADQTAET